MTSLTVRKWRSFSVVSEGPPISTNSFVSRCIWLKIIENLEWIGTCGFVNFQKTRKCDVLGAFYSLYHGTSAYFRVKIRTHTRHISQFFGNWQNSRCLFTPDLRLFKSNTARDEGISANSQTQHWRTAIFWLAVTSSQALFPRRIEESSQPGIIL